MSDPSISLDTYQRLTRWTYAAISVLFGVVGIAATVTGGLHGGLLAAAVLATALTCASALRWPEHPWPLALGIAAVVGAVGWSIAVWVGASPAVAFALFLPLTYALATRRSWWRAAVPLLTTLLLALAIASTAGRLDAERGLADQVTALLLLGAEVIAFLATELGWVLFTRMDAHRASENELAITRERLRFANDLHDLQGHTLVAIKLKAELARRSLPADPDAARRELADIERLVGDVSAQTRQIANDHRVVALAAELANAGSLLAAVGIDTVIDPAPQNLGRWEGLVATAIREGISNVLRHSAAQTVSIRFASGSVTITNDGARSTSATDVEGGGHGLESLRARFAEQGGALSWVCTDDAFSLTARHTAEGATP